MSQLIGRFDVEYPQFHLQVGLNVPTTGVLAVFGPSGCGKTTLLRCLAGLERSPTGFMRFGDQVWQDESNGVFIPLYRRSLGYVFQESRLFPHLSVKSNLEYGLKRLAPHARRLSFDQVVQILGLDHLLDRRPWKLSGGEQQRVAIGRALLTSPSLLMLDEPLSSLDTARKAEILPFIQNLSTDLCIPLVYVSHNLNEVLQLAGTVVLLKEGKVVASGAIQEVFARLDLRGYLPDQEVGAILDSIVVGQETEFGLTQVKFLERTLYVPKQELPNGAKLRLHILSRDVSLTVGPHSTRSSVLNVLEATVLEIGQAREGQHTVDVKLDIGCPLLASITRKSLIHLALKPGQRVYAHIKAVALSQDFRN